MRLVLLCVTEDGVTMTAVFSWDYCVYRDQNLTDVYLTRTHVRKPLAKPQNATSLSGELSVPPRIAENPRVLQHRAALGLQCTQHGEPPALLRGVPAQQAAVQSNAPKAGLNWTRWSGTTRTVHLLALSF